MWLLFIVDPTSRSENSLKMKAIRIIEYSVFCESQISSDKVEGNKLIE